MLKQILKELISHSPFTLFGATFGICLIFLFKNLSADTTHNMFYFSHSIHILLSSCVTSSIYRLHTCSKGSNKRCNLPFLLFLGFTSSIGLATLSDSIIPYLGEFLLDMPFRHHHVGFIEQPLIIFGVATIGAMIAYFRPSTKFPHAGHLLISTWASLSHILMAKGANLLLIDYIGIFFFLFLAVWIPCCFSDIVFPLLFVKQSEKA